MRQTHVEKCRVSVADDVDQLTQEEARQQVHQRRTPEIGRIRK